MSKTKLVLGLSMVVALFALTATPALARWTNHEGKGSGSSGEVTLTYEGGTVKCVRIEETYTVTILGIVLKKTTQKWVVCKSLGLEATVTCPSMEFKQPEKEGTEKGKATVAQNSAECVVKATGCEISIPTTGNTELKTTSMKKSGSNVASDVEITGIAATAKGSGCALGGVSKEKTTTATLKIPAVVDEGVGLE